jgi:hypothetical protein
LKGKKEGPVILCRAFLFFVAAPERGDTADLVADMGRSVLRPYMTSVAGQSIFQKAMPAA